MPILPAFPTSIFSSSMTSALTSAQTGLSTAVNAGAAAVSGSGGQMRVKLVNPARPGEETVVFHVMPALSESSSVNYRDGQALQAPGSFSIYAGSQLREFSISDAKLLARTEEEAIEKLRILNVLRGWTKPYFGKGNSMNTSGLPPDVLLLSAYGAGNIVRVPVIITSYTIDYPNDTDYVHITRSGGSSVSMNSATAVPIVSSVQLSLKEVRSMQELNNFDLTKYKLGILDDWA